MTGVQAALDADRVRGGHQGLGQHLAAEHPLQGGVGLTGPEQPDLDLFQFQQIEQIGHRLRHGVSLLSAPATTCAPDAARRPPRRRRACRLDRPPTDAAHLFAHSGTSYSSVFSRSARNRSNSAPISSALGTERDSSA